MSKHTPGPWEVYNKPDKMYWQKGRVIHGPHGRICDMSICNGDEITSANANLVAAAPDMLEALKQLVTASDPNTNMSDVVVYDALSMARTAIAKAEGKQCN